MAKKRSITLGFQSLLNMDRCYGKDHPPDSFELPTMPTMNELIYCTHLELSATSDIKCKLKLYPNLRTTCRAKRTTSKKVSNQSNLLKDFVDAGSYYSFSLDIGDENDEILNEALNSTEEPQDIESSQPPQPSNSSQPNRLRRSSHSNLDLISSQSSHQSRSNRSSRSQIHSGNSSGRQSGNRSSREQAMGNSESLLSGFDDISNPSSDNFQLTSDGLENQINFTISSDDDDDSSRSNPDYNLNLPFYIFNGENIDQCSENLMKLDEAFSFINEIMKPNESLNPARHKKSSPNTAIQNSETTMQNDTTAINHSDAQCLSSRSQARQSNNSPRTPISEMRNNYNIY
ncbi:hypothetical protein TRFO_13892 [Tritrichomonas foetus]|uniref:Uncharacterized protein n=1 Tax=Tritrichomonas foetus TaxID=1144522 RepID=A0A1J4KWU6_9EUKA|nr:hypothetical protein TRFO_13892 [Tritrichomonas foetus]|eukprot:OHT15723.1 hypothetical protein TRFO_13892 [Tritrichomonas foetus]